MAMSNDRIPRAVLDDLARTEATVFPGMPRIFPGFQRNERRTESAKATPVHLGRRAA